MRTGIHRVIDRDRSIFGDELKFSMGGRIALEAFLGFLFGYFILHPISMVIFNVLDFSRVHMADRKPTSLILEPIIHSFRFEMIPMGSIFGIVCALIAAIYAYHRAIIMNQRDQIAHQLALNDRYRIRLEEQADRLQVQNKNLARLERANRRASQFMVHDFRTHLGTILGFADFLMSREDPDLKESVRSALIRIRRQAHRMMGAVNDLLEVTRLQETGKVHKEDLTIRNLLEEAISDVSLPAHENKVKIDTATIDERTVRVDRRLMVRVVCNLISNALKHNGPDTQVSLGATLSGDGDELEFICRDDGHGIPAEMLPSIFEEFSTSGSSRSRSTGLGLAFCKASVEAHGGRIWCESSMDQGTTFYFRIPVRKETQDERRVGNQSKYTHRGR